VISKVDDDLISLLTKVNEKVIQANIETDREQKLPFYTSMLTLNIKFPKNKVHMKVSNNNNLSYKSSK
jgi:hypothetical protein